MDGIVQAWVDGWVVSRGAAPPQREAWGFTVDVGQIAQVSRHVFDALGDEVDEGAVRKVADAVTGAGVWLKVFQDPEIVGKWLGEGWWVDPEPGYLMTVPLAGTRAEADDVAGRLPHARVVRRRGHTRARRRSRRLPRCPRPGGPDRRECRLRPDRDRDGPPATGAGQRRHAHAPGRGDRDGCADRRTGGDTRGPRAVRVPGLACASSAHQREVHRPERRVTTRHHPRETRRRPGAASVMLRR